MKAMLAVLVVCIGLPGSAFAEGRTPTAEEKSAIVTAMQANGFSTWGNVELENGKWEIGDAVHRDGKVYGVHLKVEDYALIEKKREH